MIPTVNNLLKLAVKFKAEYPKGTRIQVDFMKDDTFPVPNGSTATVLFVDDLGTLHCAFDNGRTYGVCPDVDIFHKI